MSGRRSTEDANGCAYLGFFDPDTLLGFVWSGHRHRPIEVTRGGMGEPVIATIEIPEGPMVGSPADITRTFGRICTIWIETQYLKEEA